MQGTSFGCFNEDSDEVCGIGICSLASHHVTSGTYLKYGKPSQRFEILARVSQFDASFLLLMLKSIFGG